MHAIYSASMSELDEQITLYRNELHLHHRGHPSRANSLCEIAGLLRNRFNQRGEIIIIDEALALGHSVLELRPQGHPDRALSLGNIVNSLHSCFGQLGRLSDLEEALLPGRSALELYPQGHHLHWATSRVPSVAVSSSSEAHLASRRHFSSYDILIEPVHWTTLRVSSILVSTISEACPISRGICP